MDANGRSAAGRLSPAGDEPPCVLLSIVIPVFNQVENLARLVRELEDVLPRIPGRCEVIFIDDRSSDDSWDAILAISRSNPSVRGGRLLMSRGQTAAMLAGVEIARGELVAFLDADLQYDPLDLPHMIEPVLAGVTDIVCGWPRSLHESNGRTLRGRIENWLLCSAFDLEIHDPGCTLKVFRRSVLEGMRLSDEAPGLILCQARARGARISETVVSHRESDDGERTPRSAPPLWMMLVDVITTKLLSPSGARPVLAFGRVALVLFVFGTVALGIVAYDAFARLDPPNGFVISAALFAYVVGLLSLMSGLVVELQLRALSGAGFREPLDAVERTPEPESEGPGS